MKYILLVILVFNSCISFGQNNKVIRFLDFIEKAQLSYRANKNDTIIIDGVESGWYKGYVMLSKEIYLLFRNDTLFLKTKILHGGLLKGIPDDLTTQFWTIDTVKKFEEYKLDTYFGTSSSDGNFILGIPLNTKHPIYFFSRTLIPLCFNYPKFKTSPLFTKTQQSKDWVKYNL